MTTTHQLADDLYLDVAEVGPMGNNAYLLRDDLESFRQRALASRPRITPALRAVVDLCCAEPAFTGGMVERHAGVSRATAYRTVEGLERVGLLLLER